MLQEYKADRAIWEENYDSVNLRSDILVSNRVVDLLGNIKGKKVLDIGCGNGKVARRLARKGAKVVGIDAVKEQVDFAKSLEDQRKQGIKYVVADLASLASAKLGLEKFDVALSLMTHLYLDEKAFAESMRTIADRLTSEAVFIYGNIHPSRVFKYPEADYFKSQLLSAELPTLTGKKFRTEFYHHPLHTVISSILEAGFVVTQLLEPKATNAELEKYPTLLDGKDVLPNYLLLVCKKAKSNA